MISIQLDQNEVVDFEGVSFTVGPAGRSDVGLIDLPREHSFIGKVRFIGGDWIIESLSGGRLTVDGQLEGRIEPFELGKTYRISPSNVQIARVNKPVETAAAIEPREKKWIRLALLTGVPGMLAILGVAVFWGSMPSGKSVVTEPVVTEPVVTEPVVTEPVVTEPVVTKQVVTEQVDFPCPVLIGWTDVGSGASWHVSSGLLVNPDTVAASAGAISNLMDAAIEFELFVHPLSVDDPRTVEVASVRFHPRFDSHNWKSPTSLAAGICALKLARPIRPSATYRNLILESKLPTVAYFPLPNLPETPPANRVQFNRGSWPTLMPVIADRVVVSQIPVPASRRPILEVFFTRLPNDWTKLGGCFVKDGRFAGIVVGEEEPGEMLVVTPLDCVEEFE